MRFKEFAQPILEVGIHDGGDVVGAIQHDEFNGGLHLVQIVCVWLQSIVRADEADARSLDV